MTEADVQAIMDVLEGRARWCVITGDCMEVLQGIPAAAIDAVVTDPPYGLGFMGKEWDHAVPSAEVWRRCLRVAKPGAHLLAFAGTRTQHRMAVNIEDAGFEIRDMIAWVYGSGFPKSLDVSKAIDKAAGAEREVVPTGAAVKRMIPGADQNRDGSWIKDDGRLYQPRVEIPATDAARKWAGWGTALKPALEPITVARKPLQGTVAANVLEFGTGAINVDGGRVGTEGGTRMVGGPNMLNKVCGNGMGGGDTVECGGRWPANLIHDGSDEVVAGFPANVPGASSVSRREETSGYGGGWGSVGLQPSYADSGSAARFFYCSKASGEDRQEGVDGNAHPTVKPTDLMQYLCRLVTREGGVVLDPFCGSGSTGKAARKEGFRFIGIELDPAHAAVARGRIAEAENHLFGAL